MNAPRLDRARQRRVLALMGVDVYVPRGLETAGGWRVICEERMPAAGPHGALFGAIISTLGLPIDAVRCERPGATPRGASDRTLQFAGGDWVPGAVRLPALAELRASAAAKRAAWRALRSVLGSLKE